MARAIEKGATYLDKLCHKFYDEPKGRGKKTDYVCRLCGGPLETYYCEERLYLVKCADCGTLALVKTVNPEVSASVTLARPTFTPPNKWVSVEERLPEKCGEYIVCACDEGEPIDERIWSDTVVVCADYYDGTFTWYECNTEYDISDIVTHWMPLPAPPDHRPPEGEEDT